jgi:sarcosine oxidase subunit beta
MTNRGAIAADFVVNAAGLGAVPLARLAGVELPITPLRGQVVVTEPAEPLIRIPSLEFGYLAAKRSPELLKRTTRAGVTCSISQSVNGNIYIGSSKEFAGFDARISLEATNEIARKAVTLYPVLSDLRAIRCYAGLRPSTADWLPIVGPVPGIEGLILAAGHGGDGIALAAVTGKLVAEIVTTGRPGICIDELSVSRFASTASAGSISQPNDCRPALLPEL